MMLAAEIRPIPAAMMIAAGFHLHSAYGGWWCPYDDCPVVMPDPLDDQEVILCREVAA